MTKANTIKRSKVWMEQAFYDLQAAEMSILHGFNEWGAYQAEQAAEKALKAVVVNAGWRPPRLHKLGMLFGICNQASSKFKETKFSFKHLESFTFISRYPFLLPGKNKAPHDLILKHDAQTALQEASDVVYKVQGILTNTHPKKATQIIEEESYSPDLINLRIDEVKEILVKEFAPEKIILFGRFARELNHPVSGTMDILVIAKSDLTFVERIVKAREVTRGGKIIIEPLIYTPEEFDLMTTEVGEGFLESALEEGRVIYDKNSPV